MLSLSEMKEIEALNKQLNHYQSRNKIRERYYYGRNMIQSLNISLPSRLENLHVACGFPAVVVDSYERRMNMSGFYAGDFQEAVDRIALENHVPEESSLTHLDMLTYGTGYVVVGRGFDSNEPDVLITPESPNNVVGRRNLRTRLLDSGLHLVYTGNGTEALGTLYTKESQIFFGITKDGSIFEDGERFDHELGRVPVFQFVNRPSSSNRMGRSEITRNIIGYTNTAVRTVANMEVAAELFGNPKNVFLNVSADEFSYGEDGPNAGKRRDPFNTRADQAIVLGYGGATDGDKGGLDEGSPGAPSVMQLAAGDPARVGAVLGHICELVSMETSIPVSRFGKSQAMPASAEAMNANEAGEVKKVERGISNARIVWSEVMATALEVRDGIKVDRGEITTQFANPSTQTQAQNVDAVIKLVQSGIVRADSDLVAEVLAFDHQKLETWKREKRDVSATSLIENLAKARGELPQE